MNFFSLKIPPMLVTLIMGTGMWFAAEQFASWNITLPLKEVTASAAAIAGGVIALAGVQSFRKAKTTVNPMKFDSVSTLVDTGIYSHTRNPMYTGLLLILLGWGYFLANAAAFCFVPLFVLYMNAFQIGPEERILEEKFGAEFLRYKKSVRRWF